MDLPRELPLRSLSFAAHAVTEGKRRLAEETPIAFEYNGLAYAVMMASPRDVEDFAIGFTLSEGLVSSAAEIGVIAQAQVEGGLILRITLPDHAADLLRERLRLRLMEGSCGLCGLESIEDVLRPLPPITHPPRITASGVEQALAVLHQFQPLSAATGAMHGAAFCSADGAVLAVREDIGRHNALDKLVGHMHRAAINPADGFILLSARCSYELVEKTVRAGCPALVTISAPSDLAARRAQDAGLTLLALARPDSALILSDPHGCFP